MAKADWSEKVEFMVIGMALRPTQFSKNIGLEIGFDYHVNFSAWMMSEFFIDSLPLLKKNYIVESDGRKACLLIETCAAHGTNKTLPPMYNVEGLFLPPSTASRI